VEKGPFFVTEAPLADSNLSSNEWESLLNLCAYAQQLGSGAGTITCTAEDYDFLSALQGDNLVNAIRN